MVGMRGTLVLGAMLALGAAWMGCTSSDGEEGEAWQGFIRNVCGATDGPAVFVRLGKGADTTCPLRWENQAGVYGMHLDGLQADSLKPGARLQDSLFECSPSCRNLGFLRVTVLENRADRVVGTYELTLGKGDSAQSLSGAAHLKKCPKSGDWCD